MNIYAQVNNAKMLKTADPEQLDISINNLLAMARKDKFDIYRALLYYSAGQLAMQKPDTTAAINYYKKVLTNSNQDISFKNKTLLQLGDIAFNQRRYKNSLSFYDSLQTDTTIISEKVTDIEARKKLLSEIVEKLNVIDKEDSLQQIVAMPVAEREAYVKNLSKKLNKNKDNAEAAEDVSQLSFADLGNSNTTTVFGSTDKSGWYFDNASLKSQGYNDFKIKWGTRTNADNWRRKSALDAQLKVVEAAPGNMNPDAGNSTDSSQSNSQDSQKIVQPADLSFVGLMETLPLTPEKMALSNNWFQKFI